VNGVKIAVPVAKMSIEDLEYVEKVTGESLDEDKPLSDIKRRSRQNLEKSDARASTDKVGAQQVKQSDYDWFDFFLKAGVGPYQCERYAHNFTKDSMDESVLPDITPENLRTLGLKEGDILRVMRYLDNLYGRTGSKSRMRNVSFAGEEVIGNGDGGLFSGPGGALRNNTRRPAPAVPVGDVVDPKAFQQKDKDASKASAEKQETPLASAPAPANENPVRGGFDDDAWEVKPPKQPATSAPAAAASSSATASTEPPKGASLSGAMADLSLLQAPLQPTPAQPSQPVQPTSAPAPTQALQPQPTAAPAPQPQQPQATGANPTFFAQLGPLGQQGGPGPAPMQGFVPQPTGFQQQQPQQAQIMPPRQRPAPPPNMNQNSLLPPPPQRPLSAPQDFQQSSFGPPPLQPQLTGLPSNMPPISSPGQSLAEINQQRFQQPQFNQQQLQAQPTGFVPQFQNGFMPQPTGFGQQPGSQFGFQQQQQFAQPTGSPFADPRPGQQFQSLAPQVTGFGGFSAPPQQPMQTGINSMLPPALQPQRTGVNGFGNGSYNIPPVPPIPQQPTIAPLQPQKTGPPPPVRFGVKHEAKKLTPQPTGLRANLAQASKWCSFVFVVHLAEY
jgi:hypothetical protein